MSVAYLKGHVETLKTHAGTPRHRYGQVMLIGAYGRFWERDAVDWSRTRLLGRRGRTSKTMRVIDFRHARGVYVLYDDLGVYYAGLCIGNNGLGGRLKDHLNDEHGGAWTRFSWFSFDSPDVDGTPRKDGVRGVVSWDGIDGGEAEQIVRDLEALLIAAMRPWGNIRNPKFQDGDEWEQVAERTAEVKLFNDFRHLIEP